MRNVTPHQHKERVEAVLDVMKEMTGQEDACENMREKLQAMTYEDLGRLVLEIVKTRSVDRMLG
jgi:hypothetical protein